MAKKMIERRHRGVIGWFFLILFWAANGVMAYGFFVSLWTLGERQGAPMSDAELAGTGVGITVLLFLWAVIAVLTGIFSYMTRGRKEIVEIET